MTPPWMSAEHSSELHSYKSGYCPIWCGYAGGHAATLQKSEITCLHAPATQLVLEAQGVEHVGSLPSGPASFVVPPEPDRPAAPAVPLAPPVFVPLAPPVALEPPLPPVPPLPLPPTFAAPPDCWVPPDPPVSFWAVEEQDAMSNRRRRTRRVRRSTGPRYERGVVSDRWARNQGESS
jgi:hypothetical protein